VKITKIEKMRSKPIIMNRREIAEEFNISTRTVDNRIKELEQHKDRYGDYCILRNGSIVLVNKLALLDFFTYRDRLRDKNLRKNVPPYNPEEVARHFGYYNIIETSADAEQISKELNDAIERKSKDMVLVIAEALKQMA